MKPNGTGVSGEPELKKAQSRIIQLNKEKSVLTELSNRLRSELLKAGINVKNQPITAAQPTNLPPSTRTNVQHAVRGKLDQLEQLQYELTKASINKPADVNHDGVRHVSSPPTKQPKTDLTLSTTAQKLPAYADQQSSSGSSFVAKGKPAVLQPSKKPSQNRKYVAPVPKSKLKSNVAWIKSAEPHYTKNDTLVTSANPPSLASHEVTGDMVDSMNLGSSIQEVWKLLEDQPTLNSDTSY